jgi:hypothetical protein
MKTQPPRTITQENLRKFVESKSDFAFERRVHSRLRELEFSCQHSGTYHDPISNKIRQYDLNAERSIERKTLALAVECKNLSDRAPLLVSAVPRTDAESFHSLIKHGPPGGSYQYTSRVSAEIRIPSHVYPHGSPVGKQTDQVSMNQQQELISDDSATFEKISQAINRSNSLVIKHARVNFSRKVARYKPYQF